MWIPGMGFRAERLYRLKRAKDQAEGGLGGNLPNPGHTAMQLDSDRMGLLGETQMRVMIGWVLSRSPCAQPPCLLNTRSRGRSAP